MTARDDFASEHERFAFDDAAYVLNALDPEDRHAFEQHLRGCVPCQAQVAELRDLPGALSLADSTAWESDPPPESLLPRLLWQAQKYRRRRRLRTIVPVAIAACLITLLAVVGVNAWRGDQGPRPVALVPVNGAGASVSATVTLTRAKQGTSIRLVCQEYAAGTSGAWPAPAAYQLVLFNRSGASQWPISWKPGNQVDVTTTTSWPEQNITRIVIEDDAGNAVLQLER